MSTPALARRYTLNDYPTVPRALLAAVNHGYTPEQWKQEQARLKRETAKAAAKTQATE